MRKTPSPNEPGRETFSTDGTGLLVFTATYNEIGNIRQTLNEVWAVVPRAHIVVVDDNSPDHTGVLLDQLAEREPRLSVVHRPAKLGLGTAHHLGIQFAVRGGYQTLVTMDADRSHIPSEIPRLLLQLTDADFVIGSRYMPGGSCDYRGYRRFISTLANFAARRLLGVPLHEYTTSFRAFRVDALDKASFAKLHSGYSFFMESVYRLHRAGLRVAEVPIHFRDRYSGVSKIPRLEILNGMLRLLGLMGSTVLGRSVPQASGPISDRCSNCGSEFLSEVTPPSYQPATEASADAFRCTSMHHVNKPRVVKCLQCGLSQVPRSEHPADLEQIYGDVVDQTYLDDLPARKKTAARAHERIERFLPRRGRLLEVGSYCGIFLHEANQKGWVTKGIEPSRWASDYAKSEGLDVICESFANAEPLAGTGYDAVVSWDVIEHVRDPKEFLRGTFRLLKPGGILALSTIEIDAWVSRILGHRWPWIMPMHLYYFGSGSLERMIGDAGFDLLCVEPCRHYASLSYLYRKLRAILAAPTGRVPARRSALAPALVVPVTLGDVRLYVARRRLEMIAAEAE